ncbi:hypothetical protein [Haloglomus halophilum]|uniref:hypothetical protein n=1 Tax=Haloglomus halophilum TaxID=2962672 RepID=UPI0020C953E6|nr:hypothetical protein [Haloglomus halophilum]
MSRWTAGALQRGRSRILLVAAFSLSVLLAALAGSVAVGAATAQSDGDPHVSIPNVTVTPEQPTPGQRTEIRTTVRVAESSPDSVEVNDIYIRRAGGDDIREYARAEDFGTVTPGGSLTVPLSVSFSEPGVKDLRVYVRGESDDGDRVRLQYPVTVSVSEGGLRMNVVGSGATVGDEAPLAVNVSNGDRSEFRDLELTVDGTALEVDDPRRLDATLAPGADRTFTYAATFTEVGDRTVDATLRYTTSTGETRTLRDSATVDVGTGVGLDVAVRNASVGGETPVAVTVANGRQASLGDIEVVANGSNVRVESPRRFAADLGAGAERTFTYDTTFPDQARSTVSLTLRYTTPGGERRTVRETTTVDLGRGGAPVERPQVEVTVADAVPGATRPVNVTVANGLENEIRQVRVVADSPEAEFEVTERVRSTLEAGGSATFSYPASVAERGSYPVNVTLVYTDDGIRRRITRQFEASFGAPANPGEITLTGVEAVETGAGLEISATASNVGSSDVEAVVVSVDGEQVTAADYFVGGVDASDFASFTLSTAVDGNVSTAPVRVSYVVDGVERSFTTDVPVQQAAPEPSRGGGGGGLPLVPIVVVLVVVGAAVAVYRWRRG